MNNQIQQDTYKMKPFYMIFIALFLAVGASLMAFELVYAPSEKISFVNESVPMKNKLAIPKLAEGKGDKDQKVFDLNLMEADASSPSGKPSTFGINGTYLGPTIRLRTGDRVRMNVKNLLHEAAAIHWHGMVLPAEMDGGLHQNINPGEIWQPYWTVTNQAATLWYHAQTFGATARQVYRGLAGMIIVDDPNSDQLDIPHDYGIDDIPIMVQDRKLNAELELLYDFDGRSRFLPYGMLGNTILVNGTIAPYINVPALVIRLRLLNASNARRYNFGLSNDQKFYQIASDGGLLPEPIERSRLLLSPGERAEILVDLTDTSEPVILQSFGIIHQSKLHRLLGDILVGQSDEYQKFNIVELRPRPGHYGKKTLPKQLNTINLPSEKDAAQIRTFVFGGFGRNSINGKKMDPGIINEFVHAGETEIWILRNETLFPHPIHVHGVQFQVLSRNGAKPPGNEAGWKDTITVSPGETVRIFLMFPNFPDAHAAYVLHSNNLEQEDMGAMMQYILIDKNTQKKDIYIDETTKNIHL